MRQQNGGAAVPAQRIPPDCTRSQSMCTAQWEAAKRQDVTYHSPATGARSTGKVTVQAPVLYKGQQGGCRECFYSGLWRISHSKRQAENHTS